MVEDTGVVPPPPSISVGYEYITAAETAASMPNIDTSNNVQENFFTAGTIFIINLI